MPEGEGNYPEPGEMVVYVGHSINANAVHYERSKLDSILEWEDPKPRNASNDFWEW